MAMPTTVAPYPMLFSAGVLDGLRLPNRVAVAPMTRTSATAEGLATDAMAHYYASFARGGFGLVITEGVYTDEVYSQGYVNQPGLTSAEQAAAWRRVTDMVHAAGGRIIVQLMHAGALSQGNRFRGQTAGPSALRPAGEQSPVYGRSGPYPIPHALTQGEIASAVEGFAAAAALARAAGFNGIEVHGGNGYLLDQFLNPATNTRTDAYGGALIRRLLLAREVLAAVRHAVPGYPVGIRLSQSKVNDKEHRWPGGEHDAATIFGTLADAGAGFLHVTERDATQPAFGSGATLAALARRYGGRPVIVNGKLGDPRAAETLLGAGDADIVALARGALANMDWPLRVAHGRALDPLTADVYDTLKTL